MGEVFRPILIHDVDIRVDGDLLGNELQTNVRRSNSPGHHEVPDQKAPFCHTLGTDDKVSHLAMHFLENLLDHGGGSPAHWKTGGKTSPP